MDTVLCLASIKIIKHFSSCCEGSEFSFWTKSETKIISQVQTGNLYIKNLKLKSSLQPGEWVESYKPFLAIYV